MAKRGRPKRSDRGRATGSAINTFAEDLGRLLGTTQAKAQGWLSQRQTIAKNLEQIRDTASRLLSDLGQQAQAVVRRGRPRKKDIHYAPHPVSRKKRRKLNAKTRARMAAAQKARWAKTKKDRK